MDKPLLEFFNVVAHVRITDHFEPVGPWKDVNDEFFETKKIVTYQVIDHFVGNPVGWFYEDNSQTSCEIGFSVGEEWAIFTIADKEGSDHASYCIGGGQCLRSANGELTHRALASQGLYQAFVRACGLLK